MPRRFNQPVHAPSYGFLQRGLTEFERRGELQLSHRVSCPCLLVPCIQIRAVVCAERTKTETSVSKTPGTRVPIAFVISRPTNFSTRLRAFGLATSL